MESKTSVSNIKLVINSAYSVWNLEGVSDCVANNSLLWSHFGHYSWALNSSLHIYFSNVIHNEQGYSKNW